MPGRIVQCEDESQKRLVILDASFCTLGDDAETTTTRVYASVYLHKDAGSEWRMDRIEFGLGKPNEFISAWYWAHEIGHEPVFPTIKVAADSDEEGAAKTWRVGRTLADRHLVPFGECRA